MKFNKKNVIILSTLLIIFVSIILLIVDNDDSKDDASKFSKEYKNVPINNKFKYVNINEAIEILQNKTGVLFMGFSECRWCQEYAKYLNESLIDTDINTIYYLDIYKDRENNSKKYKELVKILNNNLSYDNIGNRQILVPSTTFVLNGIITNYDDETSFVSKHMNNIKDYWTEEKTKQFKNKINEYANSLFENGVCKDKLGC